jgi:hypothetical protein
MVSVFTRTESGFVLGSVGSIFVVFGVAMSSSSALASKNTSSCLAIVSSTAFKYLWVVLNDVVLWSVYVCKSYSVLCMLSYLC